MRARLLRFFFSFTNFFIADLAVPSPSEDVAAPPSRRLALRLVWLLFGVAVVVVVVLFRRLCVDATLPVANDWARRRAFRFVEKTAPDNEEKAFGRFVINLHLLAGYKR